MATPKPGEIRCPTCHRSTPPATFCTQCGSPIPADARARPRGMDRDELQDRIRARRSGGDPFRRGAGVGAADAGYERFAPSADDANIRRLEREPGERRVDYFDEARAVPPPRDVTRDRDVGDERWSEAPAGESQPSYRGPTPGETYPDEAYAGYDADDYVEPYEYAWDDQERRSGGGAGFAILGVLALGVLALLGGVFLAGLFGDGVADATPSPTPSVAATPEPTVEPTPSVSASSQGPSGSAAPTGLPVVFPDGFVAQAEPCIPGSADIDGCDSNGAQNSGSVWVWVGFENGTEDDVIGATLLDSSGSQLAEGSIDLRRINCIPDCPGGWTYFPFSGLDPGQYTVRVTRNGELADETAFEVT